LESLARKGSDTRDGESCKKKIEASASPVGDKYASSVLQKRQNLRKKGKDKTTTKGLKNRGERGGKGGRAFSGAAQ